MTDRELLEMAAKAAGAEWLSDRWVALRDDGVWHTWDPLEDDGDALRLAVKLNLLIDCVSQCARPLDDSLGWFDGDSDEDDQTAVRRAIVRAAAEIGATKEA